jgi:hypothetical protein
MSAKKNCCLLSFDYVDFDVFLNARIFYRLAGYHIVSPDNFSICDLIVVFRGIPPCTYIEYSGEIHFYDYVCEHRIKVSDYFPNATSITVITIDTSVHESPLINTVYGYLPVFPRLWQFSLPFAKKSTIPIHVSNYKPLIDDSFQVELITLIRAGKIRVYGAKWDRIQVKARSLSYLSANLKLASASCCYGLMYPYQRGKSLSGRMWQAPIHGCIVISENNTNIFSCPGVFEVAHFNDFLLTKEISSSELAREATSFWSEKTKCLAADLKLSLNLNSLPREIVYSRFLMLCQHCDFYWNLFVVKKSSGLTNRMAISMRAIRRVISSILS